MSTTTVTDAEVDVLAHWLREQVGLTWDTARAHAVDLITEGYRLPQHRAAEPVPLPEIAHKGPDDSDAAMFKRVAWNLRNGFEIGGSNVKVALIRLIDREVARSGQSPTPRDIHRGKPATCGCTIGGLHRYQCAGVGHVDPPR